MIALVAALVAGPGAVFADSGARAGQYLLSQSPAQTVRVLDAETREPIMGAIVTGFGERLSTDPEGRGAWPGQGPFVVAAPGYEPARLESPRAEVRLRPRVRSGLVVSADGEPISGAVVAHDGRWAETDATGRFFYQGEIQGPVIVKRAGYRPFEGDWDGTAPLVLEPIDIRALYISFPRLSPEWIPGLFENMARAGFNAFVVDAKSDRGLLAWESNVPLANQIPDINNQAYLPLPELLEMAKQYNFYTIARVVTFKDHPLATTFPERAVHNEDGTLYIDQEELAWASPLRPDNWEYNVELGKELAAMGFDEINYDYIRMPSDGAILNIAWPEGTDYDARTTAISSFLNEVRLALRPTRALFSGDVFGLVPTVPPGFDMGIGQTLETMAPYMDVLCPMVYPSTFIPGNLGLDDPTNEPYEVVYRSMVAANERSPIPVRPWLQGYWFEEPDWAAGVQAALDTTDQGFIFWLASGGYPEHDYGGILSAALPTEPNTP